MAVIKRLNEYGPVQNTRRVVNTPTPEIAGAATGRALQELGSTINQIQLQTERAKQDSDIALSDIRAREDLDAVRRDIENDTSIDPATYEDLWKQRSTEVLGKYAKSLQSNYASEQWKERAAGYQSEGTIKLRDTKRRRDIDAVKGSMIEAGMAYERQALDANVPTDMLSQTRGAYEAIIKSQVASGILSREEGATRLAQADEVDRKGKFARARAAVEALVEAGDDAGAKKIIEGFGDVEEGRALRQAKESAEQDIRARQNRAEAEKRKTEVLAANTFEMGLLKGEAGHGYKDLDTLVASGAISTNDAPSLRRSIRAEHDRAKAEADSSKMSAAEKEQIKDRSADYRLVFDAVSMFDPSQFVAGYDKWSDDLKARYDRMTPDDQRAVDRKVLETSMKGQTTGAAKDVYDALVAEAKRVVPDWQIGSTAAKAPDEGKEFAGKLAQVAETIAKDTSGNPLTVQQTRDAVARALSKYQPGKWGDLPTNQADNPNSPINARLRSAVDPNYDYRAEELIRDEFYRTNGRSPTQAELSAAYAAVKAQ